eukprot:g19404.t1
MQNARLRRQDKPNRQNTRRHTGKGKKYLLKDTLNDFTPEEEAVRAVSDPWDAEFVDVPQELLFGLIQAANFLEATSLLDLCCAKVASMIK